MADIGVYSAAEVTLSVGGATANASDLGQGDAIKVTPSGPTFKLRKGIGGGASRARQYPHIEITIKVRQTSSYNSILSAILTADRATAGGAGIVPVVLKDRLGTHTLVEVGGFIEGDPEVVYGEEESDLEWKVICPDPNQFVGGH
jgi:hypothetical protein